ncbi:MAG TPA: PDZ domain-containing protein [Pirellulaceae bacterium]|nr:PDZ domain-containing protein [Pirellulaceae bacterium]
MRLKIYGPLAVWLALAVLSGPAVAQSLLDRLEKQLKEQAAPAPLPEGDALAPEPGFLGLSADNVAGGVKIVSVRAGGPADQAGLKPGDQIISAGGVEIKELNDMAGVVGKLPAGAKVEFIVRRAGRDEKLLVELAQRAETPEALPVPRNTLPPRDPLADPLDEPRPEIVAGPAQLGVRAEPVTLDRQRMYGLTVRRGAVIEGIVQGSPAERFGLPIGAAIVAVDGQRVDSPEDLAAIIGSSEVGQMVELSYYQRDQAFRKKVRLVPNAVVAAPGAVPGDRPLLRKLERVIGGVVPNEQPLPPQGNITQLQALQEQVDQLQARVEMLESRLRAMEQAPARPTEPKLTPPVKPLEP